MSAKKAFATAVDVSACYWTLSFASLVLGQLDVWRALAGFAMLLALRVSYRFRVPVATLAMEEASELFLDLLDWDGASAVVRVRVRGEGGLRIFLSASTLLYAATLIAALAFVPPLRLDYSRVAVLLATFALSVLFYRSLSTYVRSVGVSVFVPRALAYTVLTSLLVWLVIGEDGSLVLSALLSFLAAIVGCDVLTVKWALLNGARTLTIGGLGLYDAVISIPVLSYFVSSLLTAVLGALP